MMGGRAPVHEDRLAEPDEIPLEVEQQRMRRRAVRNVRSLTAENVSKVLTHERYWTRDFVQVYLDRCDLRVLDDPALAAALAEHGACLTERIRIGSRFDQLPSIAERSSWRLRALGIRADTQRVLGEHAAAGETLADAYRLCAREAVSHQSLAELHRRRALWVAGRDPEEATLYLTAAVRLSRDIGERPRRGEAHLARAWLAMTPDRPSGLADLARAVAASNPRRPRSTVVFRVALDRLWRVLARVPSLAVDEEPSALRSVHRAQRRFYGHSTKSVAKTMLYWTEALLTRRLGVERHTERRLRLARDTFTTLGAGIQAFLVHLDLAEFYEQQGQRRRAIEALGAARAFVEVDPPRMSAILDAARAELDRPLAYRTIRHDACDLLPMEPAPDVLVPSTSTEVGSRSILRRA